MAKRKNSLFVDGPLGAAHGDGGMSEKSEAKKPRRNRTKRKALPPSSGSGWQVAIKRLGKIRDANVELAPLTLLLGRNNTGKSYLATFLWAITEFNSLLNREYAESRRPAWFKELFNDVKKGDSIEFELTSDRAESLVDHLNDVLEHDAAAWLGDIFVLETFAADGIRIIPAKPLKLTVSIASPNFASQVTFTTAGGGRDYTIGLPGLRDGFNFTEDFIFTELVRAAVFGTIRPAWHRPIYIPAARTGLMLAFPALVSETLGALGAPNVSRPKLNVPTSQFLQTIAYGGPQGFLGRTAHIADWLEKETLHGKVMVSRQQKLPSFHYEEPGSNLSLPLHATSSMITELAPFLMALRLPWEASILVIEEPEAHLHLSAQRKMAQAIARIVNLGVPVVVTSHSDTFVQEINNLLQLHSSPERDRLIKKLGYDPTELIDPNKVKGYEFVETNEGTEVIPLALVREGFIVPSLNEAIRELAKETILIQEGAAEEDD